MKTLKEIVDRLYDKVHEAREGLHYSTENEIHDLICLLEDLTTWRKITDAQRGLTVDAPFLGLRVM